VRAVLSGSRSSREIDENLIRRDLTPVQKAKLIAKRKAVYEAVHPETRRAAPGAGGIRSARLADLSTASQRTPP
jgi:hypothetical protein